MSTKTLSNFLTLTSFEKVVINPASAAGYLPMTSGVDNPAQVSHRMQSVHSSESNAYETLTNTGPWTMLHRLCGSHAPD